MVGLEGNNGFNNNADEKRTATEDFQAFYVRSKQSVLEQHINAVRLYNEIKGNVKIQRLNPMKPEFTEAMLMHIYDVDELRVMDGAEKRSNEQKTQKTVETITEFGKDQKIIGFLSGCGIKDEELEVISRHEIFAADIPDAESLEQEFLSSLEIVILKLLMGNPSLPLETIAKSVKRPLSEVQPVYNDLPIVTGKKFLF